jgi:hypothetical protein
MIQKPKRHGVILSRLFESNLVNQPLTIEDSALGEGRHENEVPLNNKEPPEGG